MIGGVAGAGIAIGPILGGWATTELTWRIVFVGEVVIVLGILAMTRFIADAPRTGPKPRLDVVGSVLSAAGSGPSSSASSRRPRGASSSRRTRRSSRSACR